jgi:AcrR family transcriptional regulator
MQDIAEAADLTQGALYRHFSSKEEILYRQLVFYERPLYAWVQDSAPSDPPDLQLRAFVRGRIQRQLDHVYFKLGWGALARTGQLGWRLPKVQAQEVDDLDRAALAGLEEILRRGMEAGVFRKLHVHVTAVAIMNVTLILGDWIHPTSDVDLATIPDTYADLVLHMVDADPAFPL